MKWCLCVLTIILFAFSVLAQENVDSSISDRTSDTLPSSNLDNSISTTDEDEPQDEKSTPPDTTTTTTPDTTTTTTTPATTTTPPATTTTHPTTTAKPLTTTKKPSPPSTKDYYQITENDTTCIMIKGSFQFTVSYSVTGNGTNPNKTTIKVPKPTDPISPKVDGSCMTEEGLQYIEISWRETLPNYSLTIFFNSTDGKSWHILNTTSVIVLDGKNFPNASNLGKAIQSNLVYTLAPDQILVNRSYQCFSEFVVTNVTTTMEGIAYDLPVVLTMSAVQIQAFNKIPKTKSFVQGTHCQMDNVADVVPIAVGCALAGLVVLVAIAYVIGRRRRSAAYQSV